MKNNDDLEKTLLKQLWVSLSRRFSPPSKSFVVFKEIREFLQIVEISNKKQIEEMLDNLQEEFEKRVL